MTDLRQQLDAEPDRPQSWNPTEKGCEVIGRICSITKGMAEYGEVQVCNIEQDDGAGLVAVWITRSVLKAKFEALNPQPGDRIAIRYEGQPPGKKYHVYKMAVERASGTPYADATVRRPDNSKVPAEPDFADPFTDGDE